MEVSYYGGKLLRRLVIMEVSYYGGKLLRR